MVRSYTETVVGRSFNSVPYFIYNFLWDNSLNSHRDNIHSAFRRADRYPPIGIDDEKILICAPRRARSINGKRRPMANWHPKRPEGIPNLSISSTSVPYQVPAKPTSHRTTLHLGMVAGLSLAAASQGPTDGERTDHTFFSFHQAIEFNSLSHMFPRIIFRNPSLISRGTL